MELNKIFLGDCLEILRQLPDNSVDAIITDPPYASGGRSISEKSLPPSQKYEQTDNKTVHRPDFFGDTKDSRSWLHLSFLVSCSCHCKASILKHKRKIHSRKPTKSNRKDKHNRYFYYAACIMLRVVLTAA